MVTFGILPKGSLSSFQDFNKSVYGLPNDRLFSLSDILTNQQRFTMRALKGIRKGDMEKLKINLLIALSFFMSTANRLHLDVEQIVWNRFPGVCSYCGKAPCVCKKIKASHRVKVLRKKSMMPTSIAGFQALFAQIYPPTSRTLADAWVHLAEEMGEMSEAIHFYLGEHSDKQFKEVESEMADYISCIFGVANSAQIDIAKELSLLFDHNCHVCHQAPCICSYTYIASYHS